MTPKTSADANQEPKKGILASDVVAAFDARPIRSIYPASDQDGFDGGWIVATGPDSWQWFATREEAENAKAHP